MHYKDSVGLVHLSNFRCTATVRPPYLIAEQQLAKMQTGSIKKILKRIQIELDFVKYSEKMGYRNWLKKTTQIFLLIDKHNTLDNNLHIK